MATKTQTKPSIREIFEQYISVLGIENRLSSKTQEAYIHDIKVYLQYIIALNKRIDDVVYEDIFKYLYRQKRTLASTSLARHISSIKHFHRFLIAEEYTVKDPTKIIETPRLPKKLPKFLNYPEIEKILNEPDTRTTKGLRHRVILETLYATGMRVSELTTLKLHDVNFKQGTVKCLGKGDKERIIPINQGALDIIEQYINRVRSKCKILDTEILILSGWGRQYTKQGIWKIFKRYAGKANILKNTYPHIFRHSMATHMLGNNADIRFIQEVLGHTNIVTTQIYTHIDTNRIQADYKKYHPRSKTREVAI